MKTIATPIIIVIFLLTFSGCIDAIGPDFDFEEGLVYIDALATDTPGASYAVVTESTVEDGDYRNIPVEGATVIFENTITGAAVELTEDSGRYAPPAGFVVLPGESWRLFVEFADGRRYESQTETVLEPVPITDISARYESELFFSDILDRFVPGHALTVDFDDPAGRENYYYWNFTAFEKIIYCDRCDGGKLRNGECVPNENGGFLQPYYLYACDSDCWRIGNSTSVNILSDALVDGNTVNGLTVGQLVLNTKEDVLVELRQFNISRAAYGYFQILDDLVDNNGSINAPPPAALLGNLRNPNDGDEYVLGRFTAAPSVSTRIFIDRTEAPDQATDEVGFIIVEGCETCDGAPCPPCIPVTNVSCDNGRFRTSAMPEGWVEQ